ncbi:hypothetical protein M9458_027843, partial [Cirrhinus mrigala]
SYWLSKSVSELFLQSGEDGDQIIYSWTLNRNQLTHGLKDGNSSIDLDEGTDGNISCSVKNHISQGQKTIRVKPCP